jgi:hypothetical protein
MRFKQWFYEAVEYQHENFPQYLRKFKNRISRLETSFTKEAIESVQKDIKKLMEDGEFECMTRLSNWADSAYSLLETYKTKFKDVYELSKPVEYIDYILKKNYYEIINQYEKSKTIFEPLRYIFRIDTSWHSYQELYDDVNELLKDPDTERYIKENCGMEAFNAILKGIRDMDDFLAKIERYKSIVKDMEREIIIWANSVERRKSTEHLRSSERMPPHEPFEYLYHASSNVPAIMREGFKTKKELGRPTGLGGGSSDLISFTANPKIARAIASALKIAVKIAKGEITFDDIAKKYGRFNILSKDDIQGRTRYSSNPKENAFSLYRLALMRIQNKGLGYDPTFGFPEFEMFAQTDIQDIGVIKAKVDMSKVQEYLPAEEEYRVPPDAISDISVYQ